MQWRGECSHLKVSCTKDIPIRLHKYVYTFKYQLCSGAGETRQLDLDTVNLECGQKTVGMQKGRRCLNVAPRPLSPYIYSIKR